MTIIETNDTAYGITVKSWARTASNPNPLMIVGKKAPVEARIVELQPARRAKSHVFGSFKLAKIWSIRNLGVSALCLLLLLPATRSSVGRKILDVLMRSGQLGRITAFKQPMATAITPSIRNNHCQEALFRVPSMVVCIPYAIRPLKTPEIGGAE